MAKKTFILLAFILLGSYGAVQAQDFKGRQRKQESVIEQAYKSKRVTELEYNKLKNEQNTIKEAIAKFEADGVWTPKEKNAVNGKLERAAKRLRKYKTNNEVY